MTKEEGLQQSLKQRICRILVLMTGTAFCVFAVLGIQKLSAEKKKSQVLKEQGNMEILVLGDSIWDLERG